MTQEIIAGYIFVGPPAEGYPNWAIPSYTGFDHITVTSITMNTIDVLLATGELPFVLFASAANVTTSATRDNGVGAVYPYTMLEHSWTLTYLGGAPITLHATDELTNARGGTVNPYTGHQGGEYVVPIREAGDYTLTLTSRGPDGVGGFVEESQTATITVDESTYRHEWYDGAEVDDLNDGLDPWGFDTSTATYTESTGVLTDSAFNSYDHTAATAGNPTDWYNWIYLFSATTAGTLESWYRITAHNGTDEITISPKLGADDTNVVSSDGAKKIFIGAARKTQASGGAGDVDADRHDTFVHLRGNQGATSYTFTEPFTFALGRNVGGGSMGWGDVHKHIGGYDSVSGVGVKLVGSSSLGVDDAFLNTFISTHTSSQGNIARFSGCHNLELDGNKLSQRGFGGNIVETVQDDEVIYFNDRIKAYDSLLQQANLSVGTNGEVVQVCVWKADINNHRNGVTLETGTHTGANGATSLTDSTKTWTIDEWNTTGSPSSANRTLLITEPGNICQARIESNTSDTLTLRSSSGDGGLQYSDKSAATINNGDSYEIAYPKSHAMFCNVGHEPASRMALIGGTWTTPSDRFVRDHYIYPSGLNHRIYAYNYFSGGSGSGPSYAFNNNVDASTGDIAEFITVVENYAADGFQWFCDGGGADNNYAGQGTFQNMMVCRNAATPVEGFIFSACISQCVALDNVQFGGAGFCQREFYGMFHGTSPDVWDFADTDYVVSRNMVYSLGQANIDSSLHTTNNADAEIVDNIVYQTGTDAEMTISNHNFLTNRVYKGNNFYGPNDSNGIMFNDTTGPDETLTQFNITVGETNTATAPGWADPENGDFS